MKYLITFIISFFVMAAALAALTAYSDPLHKTSNANFEDGIPSFGANADQTLDMKLALFSQRPKTKLILGNSRAQKGLRAETLGGEWFNASTQGSSISDQLDILKALQNCADIKEIVIAIDLAMFNGRRGNAQGKTLPPGSYKHRCKNDTIISDALRKPLYFIDPENIIRALRPAKQNGFNLRGSETYDPDALKLTNIKNDSRSKIQSYFLNAWSTENSGNDFTFKSAKSDHIEEFQALLAHAKSQNITVKITLLPLHNELLKVKYHKGLWPVYNDFRQQIAAISKNNGIALYDFTGPNTLTAKSLFTKSPQGFYYKEPSHFTPLIGDQLLAQLKKRPSKINIKQSTRALKNLLKQLSLADEILLNICENGQAYYCPKTSH